MHFTNTTRRCLEALPFLIHKPANASDDLRGQLKDVSNYCRIWFTSARWLQTIWRGDWDMFGIIAESDSQVHDSFRRSARETERCLELLSNLTHKCPTASDALQGRLRDIKDCRRIWFTYARMRSIICKRTYLQLCRVALLRGTGARSPCAGGRWPCMSVATGAIGVWVGKHSCRGPCGTRGSCVCSGAFRRDIDLGGRVTGGMPQTLQK